MAKRGLDNQDFLNSKKGVFEEDGKKIAINKINNNVEEYEEEEEIVSVDENENEKENVVISDDEEANNQETNNTNDYVSTNYTKRQASVSEQYLKDANLSWTFNKNWWYIKKYTNKNNEEINRWNDRMKTYNDYIWWLRINYSKKVYNESEDKNKFIVEGKLKINEETKRQYYVPMKDENEKYTFIMKFKNQTEEGTKTYSEREIIEEYRKFKGITDTLIDKEIPVLLIGKPIPRGNTFIFNYSSFDYQLEREFIKDYIDSTLTSGLKLSEENKNTLNSDILNIINYIQKTEKDVEKERLRRYNEEASNSERTFLNENEKFYMVDPVLYAEYIKKSKEPIYEKDGIIYLYEMKDYNNTLKIREDEVSYKKNKYFILRIGGYFQHILYTTLFNNYLNENYKLMYNSLIEQMKNPTEPVESIYPFVPELVDELLQYKDEPFTYYSTKKSENIKNTIEELEWLAFPYYNNKYSYNTYLRGDMGRLYEILGEQRYIVLQEVKKLIDGYYSILKNAITYSNLHIHVLPIITTNYLYKYQTIIGSLPLFKKDDNIIYNPSLNFDRMFEPGRFSVLVNRKVITSKGLRKSSETNNYYNKTISYILFNPGIYVDELIKWREERKELDQKENIGLIKTKEKIEINKVIQRGEQEETIKEEYERERYSIGIKTAENVPFENMINVNVLKPKLEENEEEVFMEEEPNEKQEENVSQERKTESKQQMNNSQ